jgi:acyl-CoA thioesterase FadM
MDLFKRHGVWPAVRKATVDFLQQAYPGDRLRFDIEVLHWARRASPLSAPAGSGRGVAAQSSSS